APRDQSAGRAHRRLDRGLGRRSLHPDLQVPVVHFGKEVASDFGNFRPPIGDKPSMKKIMLAAALLPAICLAASAQETAWKDLAVGDRVEVAFRSGSTLMGT